MIRSDPVAEAPPILRGVLHAIAAPCALVAGLVLVRLAPTAATRVGDAVFVGAACVNFTTSAALHRGHWSPATARLVGRMDHVSIFLLIAGSYTAIGMLLLEGAAQVSLLVVAWTGALLGICFRVFWFGVPRWLSTVVYVVLGWLSVAYVGQFAQYPITAVPVLVAVGGLLYTVGGVVYGLRWPGPSARWFGFHEVFHFCTVAAFVVHYTAVSIATYAQR